MALPKQDIRTYFGQCRCCLNYAYLKNMWKDEMIDGEAVQYGNMLVDCFSISWIACNEPSEDKICDMCILKLRDAVNFKNQVIQSQQELFQECEAEDSIDIKVQMDSDSSDVGEKTYEDVQFLEEEILEEVHDDEDRDYTPEKRKRKWPKKLPKQQQNKTYRQYTDDQLKEALAEIKRKKTTISEAARNYGVPRSTLKTKNKLPTETQPKKMNEFIKEVKAVLEYTNATPFRASSYKYTCIYCSTDIENPNKLREHTHTKHTNQTKDIEFAMRPQYYNEMVRMEVTELKCKCGVEATWPDMMDHLENEHAIDLEESRKRIIPYTLKVNEITCALCDYSSCFTSVDKHMNQHYKNHICGQCGDTFVTVARLNGHWKRHVWGVFTCDQCDKAFTREQYRKKHVAMVHQKKLLYKCAHCDERFHSDVLKHKHMEKEHQDKLERKTCPICNKVYTFGAAYTQHIRTHTRSRRVVRV